MDEGKPTGPDESLTETVKRTIESGQSFATAEIAKAKLRAGLIAAGARDITIFIVIAVMLLPAVIAALLMGLILGLAPHLGIWGATAVTVGGTAVFLLVLLGLAWLRLKRLKQDAEL